MGTTNAVRDCTRIGTAEAGYDSPEFVLTQHGRAHPQHALVATVEIAALVTTLCDITSTSTTNMATADFKVVAVRNIYRIKLSFLLLWPRSIS